ncbi:hypothetical protein ASE37_21815 [Rhizobium sp. Root268]|nr:hypothetical protein ASC86_23245 [Rhizobium sp. Root1212]KRD35160.1 hypothetical protein ASE37_21815 [Rhizobium sp. Root268]
MNSRAARTEITADRVLKELAKIGFACPTIPPTLHSGIDDIQTAASCLHALLDAVYAASTEIQYRLPDGGKDRAAERLSSLLIIARDEAERIEQRIEAYIDAARAEGAGK